MAATPGTNPIYENAARWVTIIDPTTGLPVTSFGGGSTSPNAPAQVATASGANGISRAPVTVGTTSTSVAPLSTVARVVEITNATSSAQMLYLAIGRAATATDIPVPPGGVYTSPVPITGQVNGIVATGNATSTLTEYL